MSKIFPLSFVKIFYCTTKSFQNLLNSSREQSRKIVIPNRRTRIFCDGRSIDASYSYLKVQVDSCPKCCKTYKFEIQKNQTLNIKNNRDANMIVLSCFN